jgi:hypothetical protein
MTKTKRAFILGAGFSKPAGMPLATEVLPLLAERLDLEEMEQWLGGLRERLAWMNNLDANSFRMSIEEVFHFAHFDAEVYRLRQHMASVGRGDGPGTYWNQADSIDAWLSYLEDTLRDVILELDERCDLAPILRWAKCLNPSDPVLTFNYDTLAERTFAQMGNSWHHGMERGGAGIGVYKLHGSIDWIVAHRRQSLKCELLFDKENTNRSDCNTGHVEDDYRVWRCTSRDQLLKWIAGRDLQNVPEGAMPMRVGIAGLGSYKPLHQVPGLGLVWEQALHALYGADSAIIAGFSMSDFDAMAQLQFSGVARERDARKHPLPVIVIDPYISEQMKDRFRRVFRTVDFVISRHEEIDWPSLLSKAGV